MRIAVISDIHANLHALEAVLAAVDAEGVDELWCLGDTVGYGPRPNRCCAIVHEIADLCLAGNHDLAAIGMLPLDVFNGDAGLAIRWTQAALEDDARGFLRGLEPSATRPGVELFHASPVDPVWDYVLSEGAAVRAFAASTAPLVLVGHSHVALALTPEGDGVAGGLASESAEVDLSAGRWLLNPGSVGQPRGGDPRASWLLLDGEHAAFKRVEYPVELTQAEIRERGLPEGLAARLTRGE